MKEIIFADGEFPGLNSNGTDFLSLALVKSNTEELYLEIMSTQEINPWTKENVVPYLNGSPISKEEAKEKIINFVGTDKPYFMSYVNQFDWMGICGLFGVFEVPFFWIPLDFASILYSKGINPETTPEELAVRFKIDLSNHKKHNALDDARLIKHLYEKIKTLDS